MAGGCLRRAFAVGLAYMGRREDVSCIPDDARFDDIGEVCKQFGLTLVGEGNSGEYKLSDANTPVLIIYDMEIGLTDDGRKIQHAVFASDNHPFSKWKVHSVIIGWDGNHEYIKVE